MQDRRVDALRPETNEAITLVHAILGESSIDVMFDEFRNEVDLADRLGAVLGALKAPTT